MNSGSLTTRILFGLTLVVTLFVYLPGLSGPFVFDDATNVLLPQIKIESLSLHKLREAAFASASGPLYRPVSMLSFALNYYLAGYDSFYFKLTNLIIHLLNGVGLYALTHWLLGFQPRSTADRNLSPRQISWISLAAASAWLLHPINLTSVLYVVQRMTSLSAFFTITSLLCYVHGRKQIIDGRIRGFAVIGSGLLFGGMLAILSKENGALLPLFVLTIEAFFFRLAAHPRLASPARWSFIGFILLPLFIVFVVVLLNPEKFLALGAYQGRNFTLEERLLTEARIIWIYLKLIFLPVVSQMGIFHDDVPVSHGLLEPASTVFAVFGILGLVVLVPQTYRKLPIVGFAISWFLVGHSLESTVIPLELIHEHRNYLPAFGPILGFVVTITRDYERIRDTMRGRYAFLLIYLLLLGSAAWVRAQQWESDAALNYFEVKNHPGSARAHVGLAVYLHNLRQYSEAEQHFRKAVELAPHDSANAIRLAHHLYEAKGTIPEEELEKLAQTLNQNRFDNITIWVFDMILAVTQKNQAIHRPLLEMYEQLGARSDGNLGNDWQHNMHLLLAKNYGDIYHEYAKAANHIERASRLQPKAAYYMESANLYLIGGDLGQARKAVNEMKRLNLPLNERDQKQLAHLEGLFSEVDKALGEKHVKKK